MFQNKSTNGNFERFLLLPQPLELVESPKYLVRHHTNLGVGQLQVHEFLHAIKHLAK